MCVKEREEGMNPFPFLRTIITRNSLLFLCYIEDRIIKKNRVCSHTPTQTGRYMEVQSAASVIPLISIFSERSPNPSRFSKNLVSTM